MNSYFNPKAHRVKTALKSVQSFLCEHLTKFPYIVQKTIKKNHTINLPKNCPKYHAQKMCIKSTLSISVDLHFWKKDFDKLHFSDLNFADYTGNKNQVWTRPKMEFVDIHFWKFIFKKSVADQQGVWQHSLRDNSPKMWYPHFGAGPLTFVCGFLLTIFWPNSEIDIETWNKCWLQINAQFWGLTINSWWDNFDF